MSMANGVLNAQRMCQSFVPLWKIINLWNIYIEVLVKLGVLVYL